MELSDTTETEDSKYQQVQQLISNLHQIAMNHEDRYVSPKIIKVIYKGCVRLREMSDSQFSDVQRKSINNFARYVTHYLLERCYWTAYGDSDVVSDILQTLFSIDGHLGKIFDFRMRCTKTNTLPSISDEYFYETTWERKNILAQSTSPLEYFIQHANRSRQLFKGKRLGEQLILRQMTPPGSYPIYSLEPPYSLSFTFPGLLDTLLQYGLFVKASPDDDDVGKLLQYVIMLCTLCHQEPGLVNEVLYNVIDMGNLILRAAPAATSHRLKHPFFNYKATTELLPALRVRCSGPQELQHICRCKIRLCMYDSWTLPNGIIQLPLPTRIKKYLKLELD